MAIPATVTLETVLQALFSVGGLGYLAHAFWTDYKETKAKLDTKVAKNDCKEWRDNQEQDLRDHKEDGHG